jgi:hypothetical protein
LNKYEKGKEKSEEAKDYEVYKWELDSRWGIARYDTDDPREWYNLYSDVTPSYLTSKSFWFIKWLVENDKINTNIVYDMWFYARIYEEDEVWEFFERYEEILMLLAIQDNPIQFLVSILK